ncbi:MAG: glycosyltransferase family 2 protein [Taibaiella sp.]|nr:glycosyltransferase family 2 protein [Taibaiella sp.]
MKIDLAYFFKPDGCIQPTWIYGEKRAIALPLKHLSFTIDCLVEQSDAKWILFWDYSLGAPDEKLILQLAEMPIDVWHAGLKLGLQGVPIALDYMEPAWIYNKDAAETQLHTSFRMSIRACLVRTEVLRMVGSLSAEYSSLEMSGVALGYRIHQQGGIIRYHPGLVGKKLEPLQVPEKDEWVFIREFFPKKWQLWTLFNKPGFISNYKLWRKTRKVKGNKLMPVLHSSKKRIESLPKASVSILVPTLDRYNYLINELEQLSAQTVLPYEVLITDQTSEVNAIDLNFDKYANINVRYFPQKERGQCVAWNKLLEEANGEYVLFLGDDADGIKPDLIEKLLQSRARFDSDMVATHVIELGIKYEEINEHYYLSGTFPITLIKKDLLLKTGFMDMFFNKNIRADHELAMRCHLQGALMIYDPSAVVYHHRAPAGGLRAHNARVITNYMSKNSVNKFATPTSSEIYLVKKYYNDRQYTSYIKIRYFNQLVINGNVVKKILRIVFFLIKSLQLRKEYKKNYLLAMDNLHKNA